MKPYYYEEANSDLVLLFDKISPTYGHDPLNRAADSILTSAHKRWTHKFGAAANDYLPEVFMTMWSIIDEISNAPRN
jgi:hypothetical protein